MQHDMQHKNRKCLKIGTFRLRATGLEPARRRHQNLNLARLPIPPYPHIYIVLKKEPRFLTLAVLNSEASGIRTPDNLIKSQVLYRLS